MVVSSAQASATNQLHSALGARVLARGLLAPAMVDAMFGLYAKYYSDTTAAIFARDLASKTHVLMLTDQSGSLCGFSTLELYTSAARGVRVIYSGDTIIDPGHWGSSALALEWLRFAGAVFGEQPARPLYWLLIVKGHRTYRFLPTFAHRYLPHHAESPQADEQALLDALAQEKFGADYDPDSGLVRFVTAQGRLTTSLADIPDRHRRLPAVAYFLERNPDYRHGHELVCLCELAPENLRPLALRAFTATGACLKHS